MADTLSRAQSGVVTDDRFAEYIKRYFPSLIKEKSIAVGVSGGGDSMALLLLLSRWAAQHGGPQIHALTVDHKLRADSGDEARTVAARVAGWSGVVHTILTWRGRKPKTGIPEAARAARYHLLHQYCQAHGIQYLLLGHQMDDQAETFLMRLCAGSGLDGLAGMLPQQGYENVMLCRPLLGFTHEQLIATLRAHKVKWVEDPTNINTDYLRPRLRKMRAMLEVEGLSAERLATTALRIARGRAALEAQLDTIWQGAVLQKNSITLPLAVWDSMVADMKIRFLTRALGAINQKVPAARLEQIEKLLFALDAPGKRTIRLTLAHVIVSRGEKTLRFRPEKPA